MTCLFFAYLHVLSHAINFYICHYLLQTCVVTGPLLSSMCRDMHVFFLHTYMGYHTWLIFTYVLQATNPFMSVTCHLLHTHFPIIIKDYIVILLGAPTWR